MTEKILQNKIAVNCASMGVLCYKFASPAKRGVPDLLLFNKFGNCCLIEVKNPNKTGRLSKLQKHEIGVLRSANVEVHVCDEITQAKKIIEIFSNDQRSTRLG